MKQILHKASSILYIINLFFFTYLSVIILQNKLLPPMYRFLYIGVIFAIEIVLGFFLFKKNKFNKTKIIMSFLTLFILIINGTVAYYIKEGLVTLDKINENQEQEQVGLSLVTLKDSNLNTVEDVKDIEIIAPMEQDGKNLELYGKGNYKDSKNYLSAADELLEGKGKALLINDAYRDLIKEKYPDFEDRIKSIDAKEVIVKNDDIKKDVDENESFTMYISGIDTYGSISTVSRTDVNLLVTVNPKKHKVLITTIPRDSYVKIAGDGKNQYDKLTHSGIYGISSSVATLENLFNIEINYYGRVNFSSLVKLVDVVGGVDIYNDEAFTATLGGYYFPTGNIHLSGDEALAFARERYNLSDGDMSRGRNHEKILTAIIKKGLNPSILLNYSEVLNIMSSSAETNIPQEKIVELINNQIKTNSSWDIQGQQLQGYGQSGLPSYSMPDYNLYMFVPNDDSVLEIQNNIEQIVEN